MRKSLINILVVSLLSNGAMAAPADIAGASARFALADQARAATRHAAAIIASEATDDADGFPLPPAMLTGAGGPTGGGRIPAASGAPKTDGTATKLGYCAWDNGASTGAADRIPGTTNLAAPAFAVIAPGADGQFNTTCAQIAAGVTAGDDIIASYSTAQLRSLYSMHVGAAVADEAALATIAAGALRDGEIRLIKADNSLKRWDAATAQWKAVGGSGGSGGTAGLPDAGTAAAPAYAFKDATSTGMYLSGADLAFSVAGIPMATLAATGLTVAGAINATSMTTTGDASIGGNLAVAGTTTLTGALVANGGIATTTLTTSGNTTVGGDLAVTGTTTLTGALNANGGIATTTLTTTGNTTVGGILTANGGVSTTTLSATGDITASRVLVGASANPASPALVKVNGAVQLIGQEAAPTITSHAASEGSMYFDKARKAPLISVAAKDGNNSDTTVWMPISYGISDRAMNTFTYSMVQNGYFNPIGKASPDLNYYVGIAANTFHGGGAGRNAAGGWYNSGTGTVMWANANVGIGMQALSFKHASSPTDNAVLQYNYGSRNVAVGATSMMNNTSGNDNVAVGNAALRAGSYWARNNNVAVGSGAMEYSDAASNNTAVGAFAMQTNTGGVSNVAIGYFAAQKTQTAHNNVIIGDRAGSEVTTGGNNVMVGKYAGVGKQIAPSYTYAYANLTGANNVFIGSYASPGTSDQLTYATAIGADSVVSTSATVVLGRTTDITVIGAPSADSTTAGYGRLQVAGNITPTVDATHNLGSSLRRWNTVYASNGTIQTSDVRLKTNVVQIGESEALLLISKLNPVRYNWADGTKGRKVGFIAQELAAVLPEVVHHPEHEGDYYGVNYAELSAVLAGAVKAHESKLKFFEISETNKMLTAKFAGNFEALKVKAELVEAEKVKAKYVQAEKINSDEVEFAAGNGCQPLFTLQTNAVYEVRAIGEAGWGSLRVSTSSSAAFVQDRKISDTAGVDLQVVGNQVCAIAAQGRVKASWTRVL